MRYSEDADLHRHVCHGGPPFPATARVLLALAGGCPWQPKPVAAQALGSPSPSLEYALGLHHR